MNEKTVLKEVRGVITNIYEYPVVGFDGILLSNEKGINITPDDPNEPAISEAYIGRDYSQFEIGQRVVHVSYTWNRPATSEDIREWREDGMECPDEIKVYDYVTYDERTYDEDISRTR